MKCLVFFVVLLILFCCAGCIPTTPPDTTPSTTLPSGNTTLSDDNSEYFLSRFLTDTNYSGKIASSEEPSAPGTLPDVSQIPIADPTLVESDVLISLDSSQTPVAFLYYFDPSSGDEYLATIISCDNIPMLIVFRPELDGLPALCEALTTGTAFSATIRSIVNISYEESMYAFSVAEISEQGAVDLSAPPETNEDQVWLVGYLGTYDGQNYTALFLANFDALDVYNRIFSRFSLTFETA